MRGQDQAARPTSPPSVRFLDHAPAGVYSTPCNRPPLQSAWGEGCVHRGGPPLASLLLASAGTRSGAQTKPEVFCLAT